MTAPLVVIGSGIAGVSAAGAARAGGFEGDIVLLDDEAQLPYRRPPVSKEIVRREKDADGIRIKPAEWYDKQRIDLRLGVAAAAVDVDARRVDLVGGGSIEYGQLVLATGGSARRPWDAAGIRTLRSLADVPALTDELTGGGRLVVVGAGLIGSEIAASARAQGVGVTLLETAAQPLPRLLTPDLAALYAELHAEAGTELVTGVEVTSIETVGDVTTVTAADGRTWSAPVVVVAVGMTPNVGLAEAAGLTLADGIGGIVVDAAGRTSAPDVFAAGDVAAFPHPLTGDLQRVEHWQHAQRHGTAVGQTVAGADTRYDDVPWCWSDQYGHTLQVTGWPRADHEVVVRGSLTERDFTAFFLDGGTVVGAVALGRPAEIRAVRTWIGDRLSPDATVLADDAAELKSAVPE
ncbi:pyridine nucleotide-disulfide oxidoreductase [Aeromicrobium marinum DSM 15272]|uniref:Pyridine nucleotide-disulfide oxidoreductase n=1 Tax=Aeromicrobium marinum DSM 15272 TaxID=585531 RepID=E2SDM1_9ACTN|nr:FAD-dependent oxidoreductase [Aeromicrobium marinum]EFQ82598.1 pyridine nucleotide-disulfide oxidoreductase [Aeromicrobium marinum DSM 15272]